MNIKTCITVLALCLCALPMVAQTPAPAALPTHALFLGAGFNSSLPDQRPVGAAAYLQQISGNVYGFVRYDILGVSKKPYGLQTVVAAGACEVLHQIGPVFTGACLDGGTAVAGTNIGGAIGADGMIGVRFGKKKNWAALMQGGVLKSALSSSVNPIRVGIAFGF